MSKTVVCTNVLTQVNSQAYSSHCQEWYRMGRLTKDEFIFYTPHRTSIDKARNVAVQMALETESDYVYFIDDDMVLTPGTYQMLKDADKDIIMAESVIRGYPYQPMHFIDPDDKYFESDKKTSKNLILWPEDEYREKVDENGLLRVDAIGCAAVLYKVKLFKEIEPPYFATLPAMTEDVYCCLKMQDVYGRKNLSIYVHTYCPAGHILTSEVVSVHNRKNFVEFDEKQNPLIKVKNEMDRTNEYAKSVEEIFV